MRKIRLTSPRLVKKTRAKNINQDKHIKSLLFGNKPKQKQNNFNVQNIFKAIGTFLLLIVLFTIANIKFKVYDKISNIVLPKEQNYTVGYLNIATTLSKSNVYLNNELVGETPVKNYELPPGNYILTFKTALPFKPDASLDVPVTVTSNSTTIVQAQVGPTLRTSSYLVIYTTPSIGKKIMVFTQIPGAKVYLNDILIGTTPLEYDNLPNANTLHLKIQREGYKSLEAELVIHNNTTIHVEAKMYKYVTTLPKKANNKN